MAATWEYLKSVFGLSPKQVHIPSEEPFHTLHHLIENQHVPGLAIAAVKKGEVVLQEGLGFADLEEEIPVNTNNTLFRIASVSKCITGLALGKMVEEEIINLDASFYDYVPYYPKKKYDFTIRQLANHTAGIRGYKGKEYALNQPYSIKESIQIFQNDPLEFEPGNGYLYNSFDFVLLSLAMQEASGIAFEDYVRNKVLEPLGMNSTFPERVAEKGVGGQTESKSKDKSINEEIKSSRAQSREQEEVSTALDLTPKVTSTPLSDQHKAQFYTKWSSRFNKATEVNNYYKLAGGGYLATSQDLVKLGLAILEQKLLQSTTYQELFTPAFVNGTSTYCGLGFQVSQDQKGRNYVGHIGNQVGGYSNLFVYPDEGLVFVALTNCTDPKVQESLDLVFNHYKDLYTL